MRRMPNDRLPDGAIKAIEKVAQHGHKAVVYLDGKKWKVEVVHMRPAYNQLQDFLKQVSNPCPPLEVPDAD